MSDDRGLVRIDESRMHMRHRSLLDLFAGLFGTPRLRYALASVALLILLVLVAAAARGHLVGGGAWDLWMLGLQPAIVVYILVVQPLLHRRWVRAIESLRRLAGSPDLDDAAWSIRPRNEWLALAAGSAFGVWVSWSLPITERWEWLYLLIANIALFGLLALSIHRGAVSTRQLARVVRADLELDLFDRQSLTPVARWGQSVSLTFVGGICLSLMFQSSSSLHSVASVVIYSILVAVSLTLFFTSIWSIHLAMVAAQERELAVVRRHWNQARSELKRLLGDGSVRDTWDAARLYDPVAVFASYERQLLEASTWPFDPKIVKEVVASIVAPILIYVLKVAVGGSGSA